MAGILNKLMFNNIDRMFLYASFLYIDKKLMVSRKSFNFVELKHKIQWDIIVIVQKNLLSRFSSFAFPFLFREASSGKKWGREEK